jgi:hypothetical protein
VRTSGHVSSWHETDMAGLVGDLRSRRAERTCRSSAATSVFDSRPKADICSTTRPWMVWPVSAGARVLLAVGSTSRHQRAFPYRASLPFRNATRSGSRVSFNENLSESPAACNAAGQSCLIIGVDVRRPSSFSRASGTECLPREPPGGCAGQGRARRGSSARSAW